MNKAEKRSVDMLNGPVFGSMFRFFLPIMLGSLLQQLYAMVDAVVLGQFVGKTGLAAVGGSNVALINLIVGFFIGLSSGASVVISQHFGAKDDDAVSSAVHTAIAFSVAIGGLVTIIGYFGAPRLLTALDTPEDTIQYSIDYLRWYFVGMIPAMIYNMGSGILRAVGDSRRPLFFLIACTVVNTILDLLFVAVFRMEVAGAAIATSISQLVCAVLVLWTMARLPGACRLDLRKLRFDGWPLRRMLLIGIPAGLQSSLYSITNVVVQKAINLLGTNTVAAWTAFNKLDGYFWPISNAIGIAVMTFVGQNYGARNKDRIYKCIRVGFAMHLSFAVAFSLLIYLTRGLFVRMFTADAAVIAEGEQIITYLAFAYILMSCNEILPSAMRGTGNAVKPTLITLFGICILRLILLKVMVFPHLSNLTIAICYPITWAAASLLYILYFKFGKWMPRYPDGDR